MTVIIHKSKGDEYYTPKYVWEQIKEYIPKDKIIYEPFNNIKFPQSLANHKHLCDLGFMVRELIPYDPETGEGDFFKDNGDGWDICVTNPPFAIKQKIVKRLVELDKPFVILTPTETMSCNYITKLGDDIQIIQPTTRVDFIQGDQDKKLGCCFPVIYICYKMNLPKSLIFVNRLKD